MIDDYFHVPLGIDIQSVFDNDINQLLQDMTKIDGISELLKKSIYFFIEYYNKSVSKLNNMYYDDLFVEGLLKDNKGNEIPVKEKEMEISLNKLEIEFNRFLLNKYQIDIKELINSSSIEEFNKIFYDFFKDIFKNIGSISKFYFTGFEDSSVTYSLENMSSNVMIDYLQSVNSRANDIIYNIGSYLYSYSSLKRDNADKEKFQELYSSIVSLDAIVLAKHNRMLNLEAKLAHTARMVFMTIYHTKDMNDNKLRELSVLSVMFHDIGRIYQALYYPNFMDFYVKNGELNGENNNLLQSHAEVGYYFPMQNLIIQDLIRCNGNIDEAFVMHTLMSVVIKYHGRSNSEISHYDVEYGDVSLDDKVIQELESLILQVFSKSPKIPVHARFDTLSNINHMKEFHSDIANYIINCILLISEIRKNNNIDEKINEKVNILEKYLLNYYSREVLDDLYEHPEKLEDTSVLESLFGINPPEGYKISTNNGNIDERLDNLCNSILNVDYASTINDLLSGKNKDIEVSPELLGTLNKVMGAIMTITTDMDKLDIFNQRINGSWEKTNKSRYDRDTNEGELTKEEVIDDLCRDTFFSDVGNEPDPEDKRPRGIKILRGNGNGNSIKALWFHLDQFITVNLRNYSSFELLSSGNYLEKIRLHMIEEQNELYKEEIIPLINEPIAFCEQFINFALNVRVDNSGKYVYPEFNENTGMYNAIDGLNKPVLFNANDMANMRSIVLADYKRFYNYVGSKPMDDEYPIPRSSIEDYNLNV